MKKTSIYFTIIAIIICLTGVKAQENFTFTCYNVLNFPNGQPLNRQDTLRTIINHVEPDILFLQELKSAAGLNAIATESFSDLNGTYLAGEWVSQQSNPNTSWPLQQNVIYNAEKFTLHQQNTILTDIRDFNEFIFYFNSEELVQNQDTAFLYAYVTHLKSSQGEDNEQARLGMVNDFVSYLETIPADAQVILAGDFNLYYSEEPAYQALISPDNNVVLEDPLDMPGEWTESSFPDKSIMTQSTRTSQIFNDGAGGGVDDRFDFMLCSSNMLDGSGGYQYVNNSYFALGNNGDCHNQNILDCAETNFTVPQSVMSALYHMSDHLPVIMQVTLDQTTSVNELSGVDLLRSNVVSQTLNFSVPVKNVTIHKLDGSMVLNQNINASSLEVNSLSQGIYILKIDHHLPIKILKI